MSPTIVSTRTPGKAQQTDDARLGASELALLPYRTMLDLLRHTQANATAIADVQRKFVDEMGDVVRKQQALFLSLSERYLKLLGRTNVALPDKEAGATLDRLQGTTLATMSEIGAAVMAAQASSFNAIKQQMHLDTPESTNGHGSGETAH